LNKPLLPEPYRVCQTWYALMTTGVLWPHIASSLYRMEVRNYEEMYAAILTLAAIGIIAYMALDIAERKLCPWKK
jgi:ABC-type nitrate/sulfonate/bicarbonate transport system permease component